MKYTFLVVSLMLLVTELPGQWMIPMNEDSLRTVLKNENGTTAVNVLIQLAGSYFFKQPATTLEYAKAAIDSSRRLKYEKGIIEGSVNAGEASRLLGDFVGGLRMQYQAYKLTGKADLEAYLAGGIGMNYYELKHHKKSLTSLKRAIAILKNLPPDAHGALYFVYAARNYIATKGYDSARLFLKDAAKYLQLEGSRMTVRWKMLYHIAFGDYYDGTGLPDSAYFYWKAALKIAANDKDVVPNHLSMTLAKLSSVFSLRNEIDSSLYYARRAFKIATIAKLNPRILQTSRQLADLYRKMDNKDSILFYQDIAIAVNESIFGNEKSNELQLLQLEEQRRDLEIQQAEERYQNNIRLIGLVSITAIILVASVLLFRSNRIKQKTNVVLQQMLNELKATQSQLVQSEKMASLGELTAGIAHEIQNPLNFVNNFAELNQELIGELKNEVKQKNLEEIQSIAFNLESNEVKIRHHGLRADAIVKSMLQHSRANSGKKELTDLNVLCDEYVRLAYHGRKAKQKSAEVKLETHFDPSLSKLNIVPQDIGRVIVNLINNAFDTVDEKSKTSVPGYQPTIKVSTNQLSGKVEIHVEDNGTGIPDSIKGKIFQPFFTSKPTGQGTGLGLSLSYDIVKAHGGTLKVNSPPAGRAGKEGLGSEFIIQLPTEAKGTT